ncbi:zinc-dependent alcohol dehydrogenase [Paenibacillus koleovorans]|uniref:zinc-dependent alcohol dehydrogenase n=1 Tax=Paenibacillus koleovorans TaxID=121608 RepID=UPI000FD6E29E|nr:zinc-binding alcohol dehydrogenase [Paenibacillus koleovorans]
MTTHTDNTDNTTNTYTNTRQLTGHKVVIPEAYKCVYESAEWREDQVPADSVLIRTDYSLISPGTELAFYTGTHIDLNNPANRWAKFPFYSGYASVGEVVATGKEVGNKFQSGQKVLTLGHHATYDILPCSDEFILPLPPGIDPKAALFARLAEISMTALIHSRFREGHRVAVLGMGLIGNLAAQLYAIQGANVIGIDLEPSRLDIAHSTNISTTILSGSNVDLTVELRQAANSGGASPDIVVEATGSPSLVNVALDAVRDHGQVILLGSPRGKAEIDIYRHIHRKGVSLIGAHGNIKGIDGLPTSAELLRYVLRLIANGSLRTEPLLSHVLHWSEVQQGYELLHQRKENALGIVLDWTQEQPNMGFGKNA